MDVNYFSKYNRNTFCYEENLDSSVKEKGASDSFKSNLYMNKCSECYPCDIT